MLLSTEVFFHRPALARYFVDLLKSADAASGLFLSAPRRTGKTTFIKQDVVPVLQSEGATVIYADLWEQKNADPASVIVGAIRDAIISADGIVAKTARATGITKVKLGGIEVDLRKIGAQDGESITRVLQHLAAVTKRPIIMVVDEAQHAQTTEEGRQTLFALKAARDAMNNPGGPGFRLLATGSNSDKLAQLVTGKDQAFFMAPIEALDPLGSDYLQWVRDSLKDDNRPSLSALEQGFAMCSHRPESLRRVLRRLGKPDGSERPIDARFIALMKQDLAAARDAFIRGLYGMEPLDAAVLKQMAAAGENFRPFEPETVKAYQAMLVDDNPAKANLSTSTIQNALGRLRQEGLVWNAGRGLWYIEDAQHVAWIAESVLGNEAAAGKGAAGQPDQPSG